MKIINFTLVILICFSCVKKETKKGVLSGGAIVVNEDTLIPYIDEFKVRVALAGLTPDFSGLDVKFSDSLPSNVLGSCIMYSEYVTINRSLWVQLGPLDREELIFHELGHCILKRLHEPTVVSGVPVSIMYPYHLGGVYGESLRYPAYQSELFSVNPAIFSAYLFDPTLYLSTALSAEESSRELSTDKIIYFCPEGDHD